MLRRAGAIFLLVQVLAPCLHAAAQNEAPEARTETDGATERARLHFKLGVDFYREGNFRAALIEFKRAYNDAPHYKLLFNLGQASLELQEYANAIEYLTKYLQEGGPDITDERRAEVEETIDRLEKRLASVTIFTNQDDAEVYIDDTPIGRAPLPSAVRVAVGRRKFSAAKQGFQNAERVIDVAAGDHLTVRLQFENREEVGARATLGAPIEGPPAVSAAAWAGITTSILGASAITLSVLTAVAQKSYNDELERLTTKAKLDELRSDAKTKAVVADVLWGATLASAVVTTVLLTSKRGKKPSNVDSTARVGLDVGPLRLGLHARF